MSSRALFTLRILIFLVIESFFKPCLKIAVPYKTKSNTLAASVTTALFLSHIAARIVQKIYKNHVKNTAGVP